MPKISIIIPAYNEEKYIEETLESANNQSLKRSQYEIIVCDNVSTDKTVKLSRKFADKVIMLKKNSSIANARNFGAKKASSKNLLFLDADTLLEHDFLEKMLEAEYKVALPKKVLIGKNPANLANVINSSFSLISKGMNITPGCCMAFDKKEFEKIGGFSENLTCNEDIDIIRKMGAGFGIINSKVIHNDRRFKKEGYIKFFSNSFNYLINYIIGKPLDKKYHAVR